MSARPLKRFRIAPTYNANDPDTWDRDTPAFEVLSQFGRTTLELDQIHQILMKHSIHTLEELHRRREELDPHLIGSKWRFEEVLSKAMARVCAKPENLLGGLLFYDETCVCAESFHMYSKAAVCVNPSGSQRGSSTSLVTGASGSGKTMFALWYLLDLICPLVKGTDTFRVHARAEDIAHLMSQTKLDFPKAIVLFVQKLVENELMVYGVGPVDNVGLRLHVVIDEAGGELYREYFSGPSILRDICKQLEAMKPYTFDSAHVTLVGTNLEIETFRFKMGTWSQSNFL